MSTPIVIAGKKMGRIRAGVLLFKETFRFLRADAEMLWIPIIALVLELFLFGFIAIVLESSGFLAAFQNEGAVPALQGYLLLGIGYLVSAFVLACTQATIAHIVYVRAHGGNATLGEGVDTVLRNWPALLLWSAITSTVGIILRMISDRSQLLGRMLAALMGAAWSVITYFVVPSIIIGKRPVFAAIEDSGAVFKRTWGETLVTNVSFSVVFMFAFVIYVVALVGLVFVLGSSVFSFVLSIGLFGVGVIMIMLVSSVLEGVLRTVLYMYASEGTVPQNFNKELLEQMLSRKGGAPAVSGAGVSPEMGANGV